jgi:hypothetical protein
MEMFEVCRAKSHKRAVWNWKVRCDRVADQLSATASCGPEQLRQALAFS